MPSSSTIISQATAEHDPIIAHHFHQLWLDNEVKEELILDDWLDITLKFIQKARQELKFQAFISPKGQPRLWVPLAANSLRDYILRHLNQNTAAMVIFGMSMCSQITVVRGLQLS